MIHKDKTLKFIEYVIELKKSDKLEWIRERYVDYTNDLLALVDSFLSPDEIYLNFGRNISNILYNCSFNNIFFREEVFEYLLQNGCSKEDAFELMEHIRKGKYLHKKLPGSVAENNKEFCLWATNVMYLPLACSIPVLRAKPRPPFIL